MTRAYIQEQANKHNELVRDIANQFLIVNRKMVDMEEGQDKAQNNTATL